MRQSIGINIYVNTNLYDICNLMLREHRLLDHRQEGYAMWFAREGEHTCAWSMSMRSLRQSSRERSAVCSTRSAFFGCSYTPSTPVKPRSSPLRARR